MSTDVTAKTPAPAPPGREGSASGGGLLQLMLDGMRRNMRQYGMLMALGLIVVLFAVWSDGDLLLPRNVSNLVLQNSYILILANQPSFPSTVLRPGETYRTSTVHSFDA
ncbi:hypothetical protein STENM327S_06258 [Streptomyces tendae]